MSKFYCVKKGRVPGIYRTWDECQNYTKGFSGAIYKSFKVEQDALDFMKPEEIKENWDSIRYTDGSLYNKIGGGASVDPNSGEVWFQRVSLDKEQTNNKGELLGIKLALLQTRGSLQIRTDSQYCINTIQNGYKVSANQEEIAEIRDLMKDRKISLVYVEAHANIKWNEVADFYARKATFLKDGEIGKEQYR